MLSSAPSPPLLPLVRLSATPHVHPVYRVCRCVLCAFLSHSPRSTHVLHASNHLSLRGSAFVLYINEPFWALMLSSKWPCWMVDLSPSGDKRFLDVSMRDVPSVHICVCLCVSLARCLFVYLSPLLFVLCWYLFILFSAAASCPRTLCWERPWLSPRMTPFRFLSPTAGVLSSVAAYW